MRFVRFSYYKTANRIAPCGVVRCGALLLVVRCGYAILWAVLVRFLRFVRFMRFAEHSYLQLILALHLLIMQVTSRVLVPTAAFPNLLWVAATKAALFRGHFLINAARTFSCGHLMRRWQFLLELLLHQAIMADPLCLSFFLGCSARLPLMVCRFSLLWSRFVENKIVLGDVSRQFGLSSFILCVGLGLSIKWAGVAKFFNPTIAPQNPAVRLLGRKGGFWCPWAFIMACQVLSSVSARVFSPVQGTLLALWYTERALIKFWRLGAPHVQRCDGNLMVGISLTLWVGKPVRLFLIGGINTHLNQFASLLLHSRVLAHISWVRSNLQPNLRLFSALKACLRSFSSFL